MLAQLYSVKFIILYVYILSSIYTHYRGKVRLKYFRRLFDHSFFLGPINMVMYMFSGVPNKPYIDVNQFPEFEKLRANWQVMRDEVAALVEQGYVKSSDKHDDAAYAQFFKRGWKRFYLKWYDNDFVPSAKSLCPKTIELLKDAPSIKAAVFTFLPKDGKLGAHRDPYAGSIRYHLGLITPNSDKCYITVDGIDYSWRDGEHVMFDETYVHSAENATDTDRLILFCDIERPLTNKVATAINRFFSKYVMAEAASPNFETDRTGFINKIYKYVHQVHMAGRRLKEKNKRLYYLVKYTLMLAIIYLIFFA